MRAPRALALLAALAAAGAAAGEGPPDLVLPLDAPGPGWKGVAVVEDGAVKRAASFRSPDALIDAGPCPVSSAEAFTLEAWIRTTEPGFCTAIMARDGGRVGLSLILGREPGRLSFEAWSWGTVRILSRTRVDDGRWHRVEVPYDPRSNTAALFLDGKFEGAGVLGAGASPGAALRLGNNIGAHQPFRGDLDEVAVRRRNTRGETFAFLAPVLPDEEKARALAALRAAALGPARAPSAMEPAAWDARRLEVREAVAEALGLRPLPARGPLKPETHGEVRGAGFLVRRVSWEAWPGTRATGWLWTPDPQPAGRLPALLSPHGHWENGAMNPVVQARAARFAREGWVVLSPDAVHAEDVPAGVSTAGVMAWNNLRGLDLLVERPDVDPTSLAVTGASGGAQQTMFLMALEDRIAAAAPVCMITRYGTILDDRTAHCGCNHAPRLAWLTDEPEMCEAFAPRPAFYGSVTGDWTSGFPAEVLPEIRALYMRLGAAGRLGSEHHEEGHNYDRPFREAVYAFFAKHLLGRPGSRPEPPFEPFPIETLAALGPPAAAPPTDALAREHLARRPPLRGPEGAAPGLPWRTAPSLLEDLEPLGNTGWRRVAIAADDLAPPRGGTASPSPAVRIPCLLRDRAKDPAEPCVVIVPAGGKGSLLVDPPAWVERLPRVLVVEPRFRGEWEPFAAAWRRNGILLGRGEGWQAAHDVARACEALPAGWPVVLVGLGEAGVDALLAARLTGRPARVVVPELGPLYAEDHARGPQCPEILRCGDVPGVLRGSRVARLLVGGVRDAAAFRAAAGDPAGLEAREKPLAPEEVGAALSAAAPPPARPGAALRWGLAPGAVAEYRRFEVARDAKTGARPRGAELPCRVFGHGIEDGRLFRPDSPRAAEIALALALSLPRGADAMEEFVTFDGLADCAPVGVAGRWEATEAAGGLVALRGRFTLRHRGPPRSDAFTRRMAGGTLEVSSLFDPAAGVVRQASFDLEARLVADDDRDAKPVELRDSGDLVLRGVRASRDAEFQKDVDAAIEKGVKWLLAAPKDGAYAAWSGYPGGTDALAALALYACDPERKAGDAALEKAMRSFPEKTYQAAVAMMAIDMKRTPPGEDDLLRARKIERRARNLSAEERAWMERGATFLMSSALSPGKWNYPTRPAGGRFVPPTHDFSNTQYAVLGLSAAARSGVEVRDDFWRGAIAAFLQAQAREGPRAPARFPGHAAAREADGLASAPAPTALARGFPYKPGGEPTGSMTCAAIGTMAICRGMLLDRGPQALPAELASRVETGIVEGFAWLGLHYSVERAPVTRGQSPRWLHYYLYAMERAGLLADVARINEHDWYADGALRLILDQKADGHWEEDAGDERKVADTCFALLFLKRAVPAVTAR